MTCGVTVPVGQRARIELFVHVRFHLRKPRRADLMVDNFVILMYEVPSGRPYKVARSRDDKARVCEG